MESPASSYALSLSDASVSDSDLGGRAPSLATVAQAANPELNTCSPPECNGRPLFEPGDGDMRISVNGTCFETHKYLIKRFQGLKAILDKQSPEISVECKEVSVEDFSEMFKVLYASIVTGPLTFTSHTLVSTLRIATVYEYPALRDYCVQHLETLKLDAVKRIEIAHEFHLSAWEQPAYRELGIRDEPITREEARIIGLDAFVHIAKMREKEQRRRGKEIDAAGGEQAGKSQPPTPVVELVSSLNVDTRGEETGNNIGHGGSSSTQLPVPGDKPEANEAAHTTQCDTGAPIVPFLSAPSAPSSKPEVNNAVPHNDSGGVKAGPSLAGVEPKDAHNWITRDGHEEGVDEDGVDPKDIDIVIQQTNCSRAKAVQTLKENNGDLINAIIAVMEND